MQNFKEKRCALIVGKYSDSLHNRLLQLTNLLPTKYQHIADMWLHGYSYNQIIDIKKITYYQLRCLLDWRSYRIVKNGEKRCYRGGIIIYLKRLSATDPVILNEF